MEEQLIEFIRKNRFLYDKSHENYRNARLREQKYERLAAKLKVPVRKLKDRWRTLKDKYYKEAKRQPTDSNIQCPRKWKWMDHLSFLEDVITENSNTIGNFEKIIPEACADDTKFESFSEFSKEDSTSFSSNTLFTSAAKKRKVNGMAMEAKSEERAQLAREVLRKPCAPKKSSIQLFCDSLASQIDEANLSQFEVFGLQIELLKTFQDFIVNKK